MENLTTTTKNTVVSTVSTLLTNKQILKLSTLELKKELKKANLEFKTDTQSEILRAKNALVNHYGKSSEVSKKEIKTIVPIKSDAIEILKEATKTAIETLPIETIKTEVEKVQNLAKTLQGKVELFKTGILQIEKLTIKNKSFIKESICTGINICLAGQARQDKSKDVLKFDVIEINVINSRLSVYGYNINMFTAQTNFNELLSNAIAELSK